MKKQKNNADKTTWMRARAWQRSRGCDVDVDLEILKSEARKVRKNTPKLEW